VPSTEAQLELAGLINRVEVKRCSAARHVTTARRTIERFRQAVLTAACSGRLTADWRATKSTEQPAESIVARIDAARRARLGRRYKAPPQPRAEEDLPEGWCWTTVEALVDVATGATPLRKQTGYYNGSIPWITSGAANDGLITRASEHITELALKETNAKVFPAGTLVVAMYGEGQTRGRIAELRIDAATNQALAALLFDEHSVALRPYLRVFFRENYERIRRFSFGGVQPNLSLGVIRETELPLPPLEEQAEIVRRVDELLALATQLDRKATSAGRRLDQTARAVLAKAFRGDLSLEDVVA
jgi:type I restriction enzyme S subunit